MTERVLFFVKENDEVDEEGDDGGSTGNEE